MAMSLVGSSPLIAEPKRVSGRTPPRLFDIEKVMPAIKPYRRKAIRLHPTRATAPLPSNASKMGGKFHWPSSEPWPYCSESDPPPDPGIAQAEDDTSEELQQAVNEIRRPHSTAYQAMVQLRRDEFPELPWPPGSDLFQLLWCPSVHMWGNSLDTKSSQSSGARIVWRRESTVRAVLQTQSPRVPRFPLHECAFEPEDIFEYPQSVETPPAIEAAIPKLQGWFDALQPRKANDPGAEWRYSYDIAASPGTKLFGWAQWVQAVEIPTCGCGREMKLLLTCASDESNDPGVWDTVSIEPLTGKEDFHHPFGFEWGDWSNAYVFYCAAGHRINTATIVQSS